MSHVKGISAALGVCVFLTACTDNSGDMEPASSTLAEIRQAGVMRCGVNGSQRGFSLAGEGTAMKGLDADYCLAVAAAIGGPEVEFVPLTAEERLDAVRDGRVHVLSRTTTWTLSRDIAGLAFVGIMFYDGEGFMVKKIDGITSISDFPAPNFCILSGTTSRSNITSFFAGEEVAISEYASEEERMQAFLADQCNVYTYDRSALVGVRSGLPEPDDFVILNDVISKEPLSPVVSDHDSQWVDIARWTVFALINAEELGISSVNADRLRASEKPDIRRFLGIENQELAASLRLSPDWAYQIVHTVGNYGELFARNLGQDSDLKMERGLNRLWLDGGLLYAPPIK